MKSRKRMKLIDMIQTCARLTLQTHFTSRDFLKLGLIAREGPARRCRFQWSLNTSSHQIKEALVVLDVCLRLINKILHMCFYFMVIYFTSQDPKLRFAQFNCCRVRTKIHTNMKMMAVGLLFFIIHQDCLQSVRGQSGVCIDGGSVPCPVRSPGSYVGIGFAAQVDDSLCQ